MLTDSSSSSFHGENVLRSPCKGAVLPKSASTAVSPVMRHSLASLPSSLPNPSSAPSCARRKLVSPQITKWFRKSTPRKLAVTPKKSSSTHDAKSSVAGVKRKLCSESDTDDSLGVTPLGVRHKFQRPSRENDPKLSPTKPPRTEPSAAVTVLASVDSNCNKQSEPVLEDKTLNDAGTVSVVSQSSVTSCAAAAGSSFCSPTVNLPNYVYDPQPRAPIGRHSSPVKRRQSRDWLTQLRLERQNNTIQSSPPSQSPTGCGQARQRLAKISKSSPRVSQSDTAAAKTCMSVTSSPNTEVVINYLIVFFIVYSQLCLDRIISCYIIARLSLLVLVKYRSVFTM